MELSFLIAYRTQWGEHLEVRGHLLPTGEAVRVPLSTSDGFWWSGTLVLANQPERFDYQYTVSDETGACVRREAGLVRTFVPDRRHRSALCDTWMDNDDMSVFSRSALADCACRRCGGAFARIELLEDRSLLLLKALPPAPGYRWGVLGSTPHLGAWDEHQVRLLSRTDTYEWGLPLTPEDLHPDTTYKYVWVSEEETHRLVWEEGTDHQLVPRVALDELQLCPPSHAWIHTDHFPRMQGPDARWRGAGVVIPVFSLRSQGSFGVGDFGDLEQFVVWAASTGMSAVQILPINDTTTTGGPRDSYPYSAISVFALHPLYFDARSQRDSKAYQQYEAKGLALNACEELDYEAVWQLKQQFLRALYAERGAKVERSSGFKAFCHDNAHWLPAYCDFCALRDRYHTANFRDWPAEATDLKDKKLEKERDFHAFVQYLLHCQLKAAHETARQLGVMLKGDIPIGICRDSVPAREDTRLFHFDGQAGAPPDAFATQGQNWGFPTYDWERMSEDGYQWWQRRLRHTAQYFDAYRIDHVLGFFRIWEIPTDQSYGTLGHFRPSLPYSEEEIRGFGFAPSPASLTQPLLSAELAQEIIARCQTAHVAADTYIYKDSADRYRLCEPFPHQAETWMRVGDAPLRDALLRAATEVLFIADREQPDHYHPRVCGQQTTAYAALSPADRAAFDRLHEDFYYVRHNAFWANEAMKKIPAVIDYEGNHPLDGGMLPCAEDLGMIPASVKGVLEQLHILSLEIQRMPKAWGVRFGNPADYPYMSVATPGTHDMSPFRLWWHESEEQTQAYWRDMLHRQGPAPAEAPADACEQMVAQHLDAPSMLCLIALQDLLGMDNQLRHPHPEQEQINCPADPNHYWRYRMHLTIEELAAHTPFNEKLRALIKRAGRGRGTL